MSERNKEIVQKVNDAFAANNPEEFLKHCAENVKWTIVGEKTVDGIQGVRDFMKSMEGHEAPTFTVDRLIANGDDVVCYGDMTMKNEQGETAPYSYCDAYRFEGDKIAELRSYVIKLSHRGEEDKAAQAA